jgi:hypothetical protein
MTGVLAAPNPESVRIAASVPNFDQALFGLNSKDEKPYRAVAHMNENLEA